jgi:hypothetical protein
LVNAGALILALSGCDKIPFLAKKKAPPAQPAPAQPAPQPKAPAAAPQPASAPAPAARAARADEPWTPLDTGTVAPGMSREQVIALWGVPVAERSVEDRTYLYFRNGCEASCGTFDVVFLENGVVVDAIVRGPGHNYAGTSTSPPGRKGQRTRPGEPAAAPGDGQR